MRLWFWCVSMTTGESVPVELTTRGPRGKFIVGAPEITTPRTFSIEMDLSGKLMKQQCWEAQRTKNLKSGCTKLIDLVEDYRITHIFCIAVVKVCINHAQITDAVQLNSANCIFFPEAAQINNTQSKASRYTLAISLTLVACAGLIFAMQTSSSIPSHWSYWFYPDHKHKRKSSK